MSFEAYIDNIKTKTGMTPADFKLAAESKGMLRPGVKTGEIVAWLKQATTSDAATRWRSCLR